MKIAALIATRGRARSRLSASSSPCGSSRRGTMRSEFLVACDEDDPADTRKNSC